MTRAEQKRRTRRWWHGNSEIRRFRAFPAMIAVVLLIPLFYGGMFVWSMWNPTENVDNMSVAVVNEDQGSAKEDPAGGKPEPINAGREIVENLQGNDSVDWQMVSAQQAQDGLRNGTYFVTVTIPEDFSAAVTSIGTEAPRKAPLQVEYNDVAGTTARTIAQTVVKTLHGSVADSIGAKAAEKMFVSVNDISQGIDEAADGSQKVDDGAQQLNNSVRDELAPGAKELNDKVSGELAPGATKLSNGINQKLVPGVGQLHTNVRDKLAPGASELADGNKKLADGISELNSSIAVLRNNPLAMQIPEVKKLVDGVTQLNNGASRASDGAQELSNGINNDLLGGVSKLDSSVQNDLAPGAQKLSDGINNQLVPGVSKLNDGVNGKLLDGTGRLADGTSQLNSGLHEAGEKVPSYSQEQAQGNGDVVSNPVNVNESWMYRQLNNGEGMVPYFACLALFIGGLFTWQALRPISLRALTARVSAWTATRHSLAPGLLLATVQAVLLTTAVGFMFSLPAPHVASTLLILLLAAWMFTALQQAFAILAGNSPGRLLSIIFLLANLTSAGGTYPLQTLPGGLQAIAPWLPFYHIVEGLRECIIGEVGSGYWMAVTYLTVGLVASVAVSVFGASQRRVFTIGGLRPAIPVN